LRPPTVIVNRGKGRAADENMSIVIDEKDSEKKEGHQVKFRGGKSAKDKGLITLFLDSCLEL